MLAPPKSPLKMEDFNAKWNKFKGDMKAERMAKSMNKCKKESGVVKRS